MNSCTSKKCFLLLYHTSAISARTASAEGEQVGKSERTQDTRSVRSSNSLPAVASTLMEPARWPACLLPPRPAELYLAWDLRSSSLFHSCPTHCRFNRIQWDHCFSLPMLLLMTYISNGLN